MRVFLLNWKTTAAGLGALFGGLGHLITNLCAGDTSTIPDDITAIMIGLGLIFAKDINTR